MHVAIAATFRLLPFSRGIAAGAGANGRAELDSKAQVARSPGVLMLTGLLLLQSDTLTDLLVTDIGLPGGIDGRRMVDAARKCRPNLPVLSVTGYAERSIVASQPLGSSVAVLTKPFALEVLVLNVSALLGKHGGSEL